MYQQILFYMGEVHVSDTRHQNMDASVWHPGRICHVIDR